MREREKESKGVTYSKRERERERKERGGQEESVTEGTRLYPDGMFLST